MKIDVYEHTARYERWKQEIVQTALSNILMFFGKVPKRDNIQKTSSFAQFMENSVDCITCF